MAEIFDPKAKDRLSFLKLIHTIHGAAKDKHVSALLIRLDSEIQIGVAQCEELRDTLLMFKERYNKPIVVYADNLGVYGQNALRHYYIALSFTRRLKVP